MNDDTKKAYDSAIASMTFLFNTMSNDPECVDRHRPKTADCLAALCGQAGVLPEMRYWAEIRDNLVMRRLT